MIKTMSDLLPFEQAQVREILAVLPENLVAVCHECGTSHEITGARPLEAAFTLWWIGSSVLSDGNFYCPSCLPDRFIS